MVARDEPIGKVPRATVPVTSGGAGRRLDPRWLIAGVTAVLVAAVVAFNVLHGGTTTTAGLSNGAVVGQVTEQSLGSTSPAAGLLAAGTTAPDIKWSIDGTAGSLQGLRGQAVLLEFFATWCPHCQAEVPVVNRVQEHYSGKPVRVIGVSASPVGQDQKTAASLPDVQSFAGKYSVKYPLLLDQALVGAQRYGVRGFPTIYVIDKNGIVAFADSGELPEATLEAAIDQTLRAS